MRRVYLVLLALLVALIPTAPSALSAQRGPRPAASSYILIDLSQQRLIEHHGGVVTRVLHVSTGGGYRYRASDGVSRVAVTPVGRFRIYRKAAGWQRSYLGAMYYPSYFTGGYAIHGSPSVPAYPASHGCVRVPMWISWRLYSIIPYGEPVFVYS
jgi:lipoprotein-anchoring transpeptidase ErfK/SrfK